MMTTWEEFFGLRNGKYGADFKLKKVFNSSIFFYEHQRSDPPEQVGFGHNKLQSNPLVKQGQGIPPLERSTMCGEY